MTLEQEKIKNGNVNGTESSFPKITKIVESIERNEKPVAISLNETNITDNRKARKKIKTPTYSKVVKRTANKDIAEKITKLEEIKASLLRDSSTQAYETSPPVLCCNSSICKNSSDQLGLNEQSLGDVLSPRMMNCHVFLVIFRIKNRLIIILTALRILELVVI